MRAASARRPMSMLSKVIVAAAAWALPDRLASAASAASCVPMRCSSPAAPRNPAVVASPGVPSTGSSSRRNAPSTRCADDSAAGVMLANDSAAAVTSSRVISSHTANAP